MVIWVYAGGGESELGQRNKHNSMLENGGLINFLKKNFPNCTFERKTPIRQKPGGKANKPNISYGKTGISLIAQIKEELSNALKNEPNQCSLILIFDDLDCRNHKEQKDKFLSTVNEILANFNLTDQIPIFVAFAAPEIESWLIADWDNSIARHTDFRINKRHEKMRNWLSSQCKIPFDNPESFSKYDPNKKACQEKLSDLLIESTIREDPNNLHQNRFSKKEHTPLLLLSLDPNIVKDKCPLFREFYEYLNKFVILNSIEL